MEALDGAAPFATYWPRATRLLERVENVAMAIVASALFATMMITVVDVVMRYGFNAPLAFAYDFIGQYLLVAAFFLGHLQPLADGRFAHRLVCSQRHEHVQRFCGRAGRAPV